MRGGEQIHPDDDPYQVGDHPMDRHTRICEAMILAAAEHPEARDTDRAIVFLDDEHHGGIALHGYDKTTEAIMDIMLHLRVLLRSIGKDMDFIMVPEDASELADE